MGFFKKIASKAKKATQKLSSPIAKVTQKLSSPVAKFTQKLGVPLPKALNIFSGTGLKSIGGTIRGISKPMIAMSRPIIKSGTTIIKPLIATASTVNPVAALISGKSPLQALTAPLNLLGKGSPLSGLNPLNAVGDMVDGAIGGVKGFFSQFIPSKETLLIAGAAGVGGLIIYGKLVRL